MRCSRSAAARCKALTNLRTVLARTGPFTIPIAEAGSGTLVLVCVNGMQQTMVMCGSVESGSRRRLNRHPGEFSLSVEQQVEVLHVVVEHVARGSRRWPDGGAGERLPAKRPAGRRVVSGEPRRGGRSRSSGGRRPARSRARLLRRARQPQVSVDAATDARRLCLGVRVRAPRLLEPPPAAGRARRRGTAGRLGGAAP
jgi:hypothetical protein